MKTVDQKVEAIMRDSNETHYGNVKIDDEFALPYDLGFDHVIKERSDQINDKKSRNNKIMD